MDLRQARIFVTVADNKSFSLAAKALRLTQPAVSLQIKSLETIYQTSLFTRQKGNLALTPGGQIYYDFAKKVLNDESACKNRIGHIKGIIAGELTIGASGIPGEYIIPKLLPAFLKLYPHVRIKLIMSDTAEIIQNVLKQSSDVGVVGHKIPFKNLTYKHFADDELVILAPSNWNLSRSSSIRLKDLEGKNLIIQNAGSGIRMEVDEKLHQQKMTLENFRIAAEMQGVESIKNSVKAGLGFAFLSRWAVRDEAENRPRNAYKVYSIKGLQTSRTFYLVTHNLASPSSCRTAFLTFLAGQNL